MTIRNKCPVISLFCSFILSPLGSELDDELSDEVQSFGVVAERDTATGKVAQCHIDRPAPSSLLLQKLIAGGKAVISIPHKVMKAQAIAVAAVGDNLESFTDETLMSRVEHGAPHVMYPSDSANIPSGSPRITRRFSRVLSKPIRDGRLSTIVPAESLDEEVGMGVSVPSKVSSTGTNLASGTTRNVRRFSRLNTRSSISTTSLAVRSIAVQPLPSFDQTTELSDDSDDDAFSAIEARIWAQYKKLENDESRRNFEDRWE